MIFYFSGTGNTLWAARQLVAATRERLVAMAGDRRTSRFTLSEGERIGFCFPVHGWQPPRIVRDFIAQLDIANAEGHYCYALCTCGDNIGMAMEMLNAALCERGLKAESVFSVTMPETYVALPFMYTDTPEVERRKLKAASIRMGSICDDVLNRRRGICETTKGPLPWVLSHVIGNVFNHLMISDKPFTVDREKCVGCGVCVRVCPVGNIREAHDHSPQWLHNGSCTACLSCYHHCPRHAIGYGPMTHKRGQYYFRTK